jgi:hypothetical protein
MNTLGAIIAGLSLRRLDRRARTGFPAAPHSGRYMFEVVTGGDQN